MRDGTCKTCGAGFTYEGRGRPRAYCDDHRRVNARRGRYVPVSRTEKACEACGVTFEGIARQLYCTPKCRQSAQYAMRDRVPCSMCGKPTGWPRGRTEVATCNQCRRADWKHGTEKGYRRAKCRCDECRGWARESMREYIATVKERDGVTPRVKYRKTPDVHCAECGERLKFGGGGAPAGIEPRCVKCSRKRAYIPQSVRAAVYERDDHVCQLCQEPTDTAGGPQGPWWPTLDHIMPVSKGGTDDPANLRTAHRWCNGVRGVSDPHGLFEEAS